MKQFFTVLTLLFVFNLFAQNDLKFDKKFIEGEDKWVAFPADSIGAYNFGFIYFDVQAGLTLDYEGSFTIDKGGKFVSKKREQKGAVKYRLGPTNNLIAVIPESKFAELNVEKTPDWLKYYKLDESSAQFFYSRGFLYNGWNECEKALGYLEKAQKIEPEYNGLLVEMAYSYNCLKQYQKAVDVLKIALKNNPTDAYTNKELVYAEAKNGNLEAAKKVCLTAFKECKDTTYHAENAYNILQQYYIKKDIPNFNNWFAEANSYLMANEQFKPLAQQMNAELKQ